MQSVVGRWLLLLLIAFIQRYFPLSSRLTQRWCSAGSAARNASGGGLRWAVHSVQTPSSGLPSTKVPESDARSVHSVLYTILEAEFLFRSCLPVRPATLVCRLSSFKEKFTWLTHPESISHRLYPELPVRRSPGQYNVKLSDSLAF